MIILKFAEQTRRYAKVCEQERPKRFFKIWAGSILYASLGLYLVLMAGLVTLSEARTVAASHSVH